MQKKVGKIACHTVQLDLPRVTLSLNIVGDTVLFGETSWPRKEANRSQRILKTEWQFCHLLAE